jgi:hypothetical protein
MLNGELCGAYLLTTCPSFVNYELCEVPFDARSKDTTFLRPQEFIQRRSIAAVHVDLFGNSGHHLQIEASMVYYYIVTLRQRAEMLFAGYTLPKKIGYSALKRVQANSAICSLLPGSCPAN